MIIQMFISDSLNDVLVPSNNVVVKSEEENNQCLYVLPFQTELWKLFYLYSTNLFSNNIFLNSPASKKQD